MRKLNLALAASVAIALASGQANATNNGLTNNADVIVYLSGSSAQAGNIANAITSLCQTGTRELYQSKSSTGNQQTYYCLSSGVSGLTDGTKVQFRFSTYTQILGTTVFPTGQSASGSVIGGAPVARKNNLQFLAVSPAIAGSCVDATASGSTTYTYTCDDSVAGVLAPYAPQLGITDLAPQWFVLENAPAEAGAMSSADVAKLKVTPGTLQIFNTPVTLGLRNALQDIQFPGQCTANRELASCTPNLTAAQIAKVFDGSAVTWDLVVPGLNNKPVKVVRREIGSGTQATLNIAVPSLMYSNLAKAYPCTSGAQPTILNSANVTVAGTGTLMKNALIAADAAGDWAMGILAPNANGAGPDASGTAAYRFVKIDGGAPTMNDTAAGKYKFFSQGTLQRLQTGAGTAQEVSLIDALVAKATDPSIIATGNNTAANKQSFGNWGYMVPSASTNCSGTSCDTNPVTTQRFAAATAAAPNNCVAPTASW